MIMKSAHITPHDNCREYILCKYNANEHSYVHQYNLTESSLKTCHGPVKTLSDIMPQTEKQLSCHYTNARIAVNLSSMGVTRGKT